MHCYIPHEFKLTNISEDMYYRVLKQLHEMKTLSLTLSGGEPMCHPKFKEFLQAAKDYDFSVNVLSNLTLVDDEVISLMKNSRLSSVQVSLYSMNPEHHDAITCLKGSFEKTKNAILRLVENDIPLQISCPTMKQNKGDYQEVLRWAHEHKVRAVTDYIMMARFDHSTDNLDNRLNLSEVEKVITDILQDDIDYQAEILKPDFFERIKSLTHDSDGIVCGVGISSACMVANGNVYPCAGWQDYVCGNVNESSLKDIWYHSKKMNFLRNIRNKDFPE
ncbi:radical SAM protein [Treponema phagedenis]|uniref:radical SAM protein n=1 Tax=Treponema phagedenis TaxID=162 RepID=UPI001C07A9E1|nr:radical SAM protein [Treponema phagedenis]